MVKLSILAAALLATTGVIAGPISSFNVGTKRVAPIFGSKPRTRVVNGAPIAGSMSYKGGPLLTGKTNIYYIYYGNGFAAKDKKYLENLISGFSAHPYFDSSKTFYAETNGVKEYIKGPVIFTKAIIDNYSLGKSLTDATVQTIVTNHIKAGHVPLDVDAVYFVLTAPDVNEASGFCDQYCGWHNNFDLNGSDIKFSFIGNPAKCLAGCAPDNVNSSPNGNPGVDGMASIIAHELVEAMSDPDPPTGWVDATGYENADKCAYVYGTELTDSATGGKYNTQIGPYKYLIQQNWDLKLNGCFNHPVGGNSTAVSKKNSSTSSANLNPPTISSTLPSPSESKSSTAQPEPKSSTASPEPKSSSTAQPKPKSSTVQTEPTSSAVPTGASCKTGADVCISADGAGHFYNECVNGVWVKKDCRKTTGAPFCYKYSASDVYCDK